MSLIRFCYIFECFANLGIVFSASVLQKKQVGCIHLFPLFSISNFYQIQFSFARFSSNLPRLYFFFPYRTSRVSGRKEFRNNLYHETMSLLQNESLVIEKNCSDSNANNLKTALHASVIILIMTLIVLGNLMVLIVTFRQRSRPSVRVANMFIANLAVVDLSVAVLLFPFSVVTILLRRWAFGEALCQFNGATNMIAGAASILTMAVISFDRYESVSLRR